MLEAAMEEGTMARQPVAPAGARRVGALDEAALYVAGAEDRDDRARGDGRRARSG